MHADRVKITLKQGDDASGLASMLFQYFEQNIDDFPKKNEQALKVTGRLAIEAAEGDVGVTVNFKGNEIEIADGCEPDALMFVRGGIFAINELALGGAGALGKIVRGELTVRSAWKHPVFAFRVARFMSLPGEMKLDGSRSTLLFVMWSILAFIGVGALIGILLYFQMN